MAGIETLNAAAAPDLRNDYCLSMATVKPKRRKRSKIKRTDPKQSARFIEAAKAMGLGDSSDAFKKAMDKLAPKKGKRGSN